MGYTDMRRAMTSLALLVQEISPIALEAVKLIDALFDIGARHQRINGQSPEERTRPMKNPPDGYRAHRVSRVVGRIDLCIPRISVKRTDLRQWLRSEGSCGKCWETLLACEVLEIRVVDPASRGGPHRIGRKRARAATARSRGAVPPAFVAVEGRDLAIHPVPVDVAAKLHQLVLQIDI